MSRNSARHSLVYPALLCAALLLFLVPPATVATLRTDIYSVLSPILKMTARSTRAADPQPASISALDPKRAVSEKPAQNLSAAEYDKANIELVRLRELLKRYQAALNIKDAALGGPAGVEAEVIARKVLWQEPL